jgi:hypothetical protein
MDRGHAICMFPIHEIGLGLSEFPGRQIMYDKSHFLCDGIMINPNRWNSTIRSIMELKIHMRLDYDRPA